MAITINILNKEIAKDLPTNRKGGYSIETGVYDCLDGLATFKTILLMLIFNIFNKTSLYKIRFSYSDRRLSKVSLTAVGQSFGLGPSQAFTF